MNDAKRTIQQNKSLHKYCTLLADALNDAGYDMRKTLKPEIDIPWTPQSVKNHLWRPIQMAMYNKESTADLDTKEPSEVHKVLDRHTAERFNISIAFPTNEERP